MRCLMRTAQSPALQAPDRAADSSFSATSVASLSDQERSARAGQGARAGAERLRHQSRLRFSHSFTRFSASSL
jgi:hypothetical protein